MMEGTPPIDEEPIEAPEPELPPDPTDAPTPEMMNEEPVLSRGVFKFIALALAAAVFGGAAFLLVAGVEDIELPEIDLPEITTDTGVTNLESTNLENTTIEGGTSDEASAAQFTSAGFGPALDEVKAELGPGAQLTRLFVNPVQTQFIVLEGEEASAYSVRAGEDELERQEATITISGNATLQDFAFPLDAVDPAAVDRMLAQARKLAGTADFEPTVLSLERNLTEGVRPPEWTISAEGDGRNFTYRAREDGGGVEDLGG